MSAIEVIIAITEQQYRMSRPSNCPSEIWGVIVDCWKEDPEERVSLTVEIEYVNYLHKRKLVQDSDSFRILI